MSSDEAVDSAVVSEATLRVRASNIARFSARVAVLRRSTNTLGNSCIVCRSRTPGDQGADQEYSSVGRTTISDQRPGK